MTIADMVYSQVKVLPEPLAREVLDFVCFLREGRDPRGMADLTNAQATGWSPSGTIPRIKSGTMFERGDLLLVPFPFTDLSAAKRRPVLAVNCRDSFGDFIAMPVTSRPQAEHGLPLSAADIADRNAAGTELNSHQSHRYPQRQSGGQEASVVFPNRS